MEATLQLLRSWNQVVGRVAPGWAAEHARRRFVTPRRRPRRPWEDAVEAEAVRSALAVGWSTLRWGRRDADRQVLCMHGWEGRATQFGALAGGWCPRGGRWWR